MPVQLQKQRELGNVPGAHPQERVYEFVFRAALGPEVDPDHIVEHGPQMLFEDMRNEDTEPDYSVYIPEGSHWRELPEMDYALGYTVPIEQVLQNVRLALDDSNREVLQSFVSWLIDLLEGRLSDDPSW